ncbi:MAG TPA: protein kinase, partial [Dehalococcoidia bacterium]|nr:protein kinase [Dehalococcoidia bacterium]
MKCSNCQTENPEDAKFCRECAQSLQPLELTCPECGYKNIPGSKFCNQCAHPLVEATTQTYEPAKTTQVEPTSFLNNRYKVIRKLGEGGKKKAYLVHDSKLDRDVVFALIKTENLNEAARIRVNREARAMGKLGDHPNIMPIHELGEINKQPYLIMPHMPGINGNNDVEKLIEHTPDHKLPLEQVISIAKDVCRGLEFAHSKGAIHRDIKPGNVWLTEDGTAKIGDFGLAVMTDVSRLTQEGMMVGTPNYLSPEQAMAGEVTYKADL